MSKLNSFIDKIKISSLPKVRERISFIYLERCVINRQENAITITDARGTVFLPSAVLSVIMLGPGTKITHRAMELLGDSGVTSIWVGEYGVRYYAHGRPLTHTSKLLLAQANLVTNSRTRIDVARKMYAMRFPGEDVSKMSMQQLRGREGARVRSAYRAMSHETGVSWNGREYDPDDYESSNVINKSLSAAHACLYGIIHSVIVALGCAAGLGFVHTGHEKSFVYDIADLYKVELTVPIAFKIASMYSETDDIGALTRKAVRDSFKNGMIIKRAVSDIYSLILNDTDADEIETNVIQLWDDKNGFVKNAVSYGREFDNENDDNELSDGNGFIIGDE